MEVVPEIIDSSQKCKEVVLDLMTNLSPKVIAVDSEGVSLGKHGELTLLQVSNPKRARYG